MTTLKAQLGLFDAPASHAGDPDTSRIAAKKLKDSGGWTAQQAEVYKALKVALKIHPDGATPGEVGVHMIGDARLNRYTAARRLPDLKKDRRVERGPKRLCTLIGSLCHVWWVKE